MVYAINDMTLTADEWEVIDSMMGWNEKNKNNGGVVTIS